MTEATLEIDKLISNLQKRVHSTLTAGHDREKGKILLYLEVRKSKSDTGGYLRLRMVNKKTPN